MATTVATTPQLFSVQLVANAFVQQYYHILHYSPELVHRFYHDVSKLGRPEQDGSFSITSTLQGINQKIVSLNYGDLRAEIKSVDSQESFNGGVHVIVTGNLTGKDDVVSNFAQTFFLAPQEKGYFVLNDMFRYIDSPNISGVVNNVVLATTHEPASQVLENHVIEEIVTSVEEAVAEDFYVPTENVDLPVVGIDDEVSEAKIVDEVKDDPQLAIKSVVKAEEGPKKSYASIVMVPKGNISSFPPPPAAPRKVLPKKVEQVNPDIVPAINVPVSSIESVDSGNSQEIEADGYSIYLKGLPMNATEAMLEEVFTKFGAIKNNGIQVRSNRQQGFCFGFVEFEEASSLQKALEASPVAIGARKVIVEEKRSTGSRGNNRGRLQQPGRGSGFRNEGSKGRGNYGGGNVRGYNNKAGDFNGRNEFGSNRTGSSNRMNQTGGNGIANGSARNVAPQISATA